MSTAVTNAPWRFNSWATRVVPVNRSAAVEAPQPDASAEIVWTRRRFEPRYLITCHIPGEGGTASLVGPGRGVQDLRGVQAVLDSGLRAGRFFEDLALDDEDLEQSSELRFQCLANHA